MYYYNLKLEDIMTAKRLLSRKIAFLKGMKKKSEKTLSVLLRYCRI